MTFLSFIRIFSILIIKILVSLLSYIFHKEYFFVFKYWLFNFQNQNFQNFYSTSNVFYILDSICILLHQQTNHIFKFLEREKSYTRSDFFNIKEEDGILMRITRKVALFFHIVFGAISWFFIWMFVNVVG